MDDYYEIVNDFYKHRFPLYTREIPRFGLPVRAKDRILYVPFVYHKPKFYYPFEDWEISVIPRTLYQKWFGPNDKDAKEEYFYRWFDNAFCFGYGFEPGTEEQTDLSIILQDHERLKNILDRGLPFREDNGN